MNVLVLLGSPRRGRNTDTLAAYLIDELKKGGAEVDLAALSELNIGACRGCYVCQNATGAYGCAQHDDMDALVPKLSAADRIVLATPIYSWYCPTAMKSMLDRLYGMQKYYGSGTGRLWKDGVSIALLLTHGYDTEYGAGAFTMGIQRLCRHDAIGYAGAYGVRDENDLASFTTPEAEAGARAFARGLLE